MVFYVLCNTFRLKVKLSKIALETWNKRTFPFNSWRYGDVIQLMGR